jgi:hypothetical protein
MLVDEEVVTVEESVEGELMEKTVRHDDEVGCTELRTK